MTKNDKKYFQNKVTRITHNYNGEEIPEGYVMVPTPFDQMDCEANCTNPECIIMVPKAGRFFKTMYKAVPAEQASEARKSYNSWQNEILGPRRDGRCMIPQPDGTTKECPRKNGDNHCACKDCPDRDKYPRKNKSFLSLETMHELYDMELVDVETGVEYANEDGSNLPATSSAEHLLIAEEACAEMQQRVYNKFHELIQLSPKHGYAMLLMGRGIKGAEFEKKMQLSHDAANTVRQQVDALAENGIQNFNQLDLSKIKSRNNKRNDFYLEEAKKLLDTLIRMMAD